MGRSVRPPPPKAIKKQTAAVKRAPKASVASSSSSHSRKLTKGSRQDRILGALSQLRVLGINAPSRKQVMVMAGYSNWDSFMVMLGSERRAGIVEYPNSDTVTATAAGLAKSPKVEAPKSNGELQSMVREVMKIPGGVPRKVFDYLCDGRARTLEELAEHCGYDEKNASFRVSLRKAMVHDVVEKTDGLYRLSDICFLPGRRST